MPGQYQNHFTAVRYRITGSGNLLTKILSLDEVNEQDLPEIPMTNTTARYVNLLTNFTTQRAKFRFEVTEIDEEFYIREILVFAKPIATGFPQ